MDPLYTSSSESGKSGLFRLFGKFIFFLAGLGLLLFPICFLSLRADRAALSSAVFRMRPETTVIVAGDSHPETAINPELLPGSINIALSAEHYLYTYFKLKLYLEKNPQIRHVVLGCSPHNVLINDKVYYFEDRYNRLRLYSMLMDKKTRRDLFSFRLPYFVALLQSEYGVPFRACQNTILTKYLLGRTIFKDYNFPFCGSYKGVSGSNLKIEIVNRRAKSLYYDGDRSAGISNLGVLYLRKIASLCCESDISLILINTPLDYRLRKLIPKDATSNFHQIITELIRDFPNVGYKDLSCLNLPPDYFFNSDHVNDKGAEVVTSLVAKSIR